MINKPSTSLGQKCGWRLVQHRDSGGNKPLHRGAKRLCGAQLALVVKQLLAGTGWIVGLPDRLDLLTGGPHPLLGINDPDQAHSVATLPQRMAEAGHGMDVAAGGEAEQAEVGEGGGFRGFRPCWNRRRYGER